MSLFRFWSVLLCIVLASCQRTPDIALTVGSQDVYWIYQEFREAGDHFGPRSEVMVSVEVLPAENEQLDILSRTLWFYVRGTLGGMDSFQLNPEREDHKLMIDLLGSGMITRLNRKGELVALLAKDQVAFNAVKEKEPKLAEALDVANGQMGLQALVAPADAKEGTRIKQHFSVPQMGSVELVMTLQHYQHGMGVWQISGTSADISISGTGIFPPTGGLPAELGMSLSMTLKPEEDGDSTKQIEGIIRLVSQQHSHGRVFDLSSDMLDFIVDITKADSELFSDKPEPAEQQYHHFFAELDAVWQQPSDTALADPATLAAFQQSLFFRQKKPYYGDNVLATDIDDAFEPVLTLLFDPQLRHQLTYSGVPRLTAVRLLDQHGDSLAGFSGQVNRVFEYLFNRNESEITLHQRHFPFRLPLNEIPSGNIEQLSMIELDVLLPKVVDRKTFDVAYGEQPPKETGFSVDWSDSTVVVSGEGHYQVENYYVVPLDKDKKAMPLKSEILQDRVLKKLRGEQDVISWLLSWQMQYEPVHTFVTTQHKPSFIRFYVQETEFFPVTLTFNDAEPVLQGGTIIGQRYAKDQLSLQGGEDISQLLIELQQVDYQDYGHTVTAILLPDDISDAVANTVCKVSAGQQRLYAEMLYYKGQEGEYLNGIGWSLTDSKAGEKITVSCDKQLRTVRETLQDSACITFADTKLAVNKQCPVWLEDKNSVRALDSKGLFLETIGHEQRVWGLPELVEYRLVEPVSAQHKVFKAKSVAMP